MTAGFPKVSFCIFNPDEAIAMGAAVQAALPEYVTFEKILRMYAL
jgi:molecular chaperone DnaK (HSP70)